MEALYTDPQTEAQPHDRAAVQAGPRTAPAACTIVSRNYLSHARVLAESFARHVPDGRFYMLVVDQLPANVYLDPQIRIVDPEELPDFYEMCFKYDVVEFCTAVKPAFLSLLMERYGEEQLIYFDPDILIMRPLEELYALMEEADIVLTPHLLTPIPADGRRPNEQDILISGAYNLGFIALRQSPTASAFLAWWNERLRNDCRVSVKEGLFVDQKWIDLAPSLFHSVAILRDDTYNIAFWNLHERRVEKRGDQFLVNGRPIGFFHFSGFNPTRPNVLSKHQDRTQIIAGTGLSDLLDHYVQLQMKQGYPISSKWDYGFEHFDNGMRVNPLLRQLYLDLDDETRSRFGNPFQVRGPRSFLEWATRPQPDKANLSPFLEAIYKVRYDVAAAFPDVQGKDHAAFIEWVRTQGTKEMGYEPQLVRLDPGDLLVGRYPPGSFGRQRRDAALGRDTTHLRVMLVSHRFPPDEIAGVERYTEALATELAAAGHTVSVFTRRPGDDTSPPHLLAEQIAERVSVYRLTGGTVDREHFLAQHDRLEQLFESLLVEEVPDLIHINHVIDLSPHFIEVAHRLGIPVVLTLHDFYFACQRIILQKPDGTSCQGPQGGRECARTCFAHEGEHAGLRWGMRTAYFRRLLTLVEQVICPSQYVAHYFTQYADRAAQIRTIPNGVLLEPPPQEFDLPMTPQQRGQFNIAYLGAIVPHKGIHVLLEALSLAGLEQVQLVLFGHVGDQDYARKLRAQAECIPGLAMRFYGAYDPEDLPHLLYDIDSVVVPSTWPETFSLVTREALVQGIPVLASRLGALPEAIQEGENGFTFDPQRPEELARLLRHLAQDEELLARLRAGARATPLMSMAQHAAAIADLYLETLAGNRDEYWGRSGALEEIEFQRDALLTLGFGAQRHDQELLVPA